MRSQGRESGLAQGPNPRRLGWDVLRLAVRPHRRTTLLIAHRPSTIALADRVVLMDAGRIADVGTHAELLSRSALYRKVLAHDGAAADEVSPCANNELVS